ncbi:MAG: isocitrate lyase/PEP mutase family protein [Paracoccaceae bacterium]|nr:isocitrate lyase/PEP mutase family protein [Paracoccaceae bacterium]
MSILTLKESIKAGESILAPGVHDMISVIIADKVGFPALFVGGYGIAASHLGIPDVGIMTFTDILDRVRMISQITTKPIIVDADTGYGSLINLRHAVKSFEKAGASAIQIEDQIFPKRCGHAQGVEVVSVDEMCNRIRVAVDSRNTDNFLIIARTDCRTNLGFDEALRRAEAYSRAGADLIFVESPQTIEEMKKLLKSIDCPMVYKMVPNGDLSKLDSKALALLGFSLVIYPTVSFLSAADAMQSAFNELKTNGIVKKQSLQSFESFSKLIGFEDIYEFEDRWGS